MQEKTEGNDALRDAGYVRVPRWWVTPRQLAAIEHMAYENKNDIFRIKHAAQRAKDK